MAFLIAAYERSDEGMRLQVPSSYAKVMRQIISGLAFLHGKHIAHRDLKPERVGFCVELCRVLCCWIVIS